MPPAREEARILLDCRWLSIGGAGRVTELVLQGLSSVRPPGQWLLWGPPAVRARAWSGADVVLTSVDPRAMAGQRSWPDLPGCDLGVFMHQLRPLRSVPAITWMHDTIQLRASPNPAVRAARRLFLRRVAAISGRLVTTTQYAKACIERDLGVAGDRIDVAFLPVDGGFADRVLALRRELPPADVVLYVGRFAPHKNLPRLIDAFGRTELRRQGGTLLLVGGSDDEVAAMHRRLSPSARSYVGVRPRCTQEELDRLFATSLLAVQPSLEEGFGLPAWEALSCGLPVCVSDGGSLPEIAGDLVDPFPAASVEAQASAIDACADRARGRPEAFVELSGRLRERAPTVAQFGEQVSRIVSEQLR